MNLTNTYNLPDAILQAVRNDPYKGGGDISVTKLIDAPQRRQLLSQYKASIVEDVSDRVWSLLGQAVHTILERANKSDIVEERLYAEVNGWQLSGQFDRIDLHGATLDDYKVTGVYKVMGGDVTEWTWQLNILRWLALKNGYQVDGLRIVAILRDWKKAELKRKPTYPIAPIVSIDIEVLSDEVIEEFIRTRVALHQKAKAGESVPCTDEERWYEGTKWALMKKGGKRAIRVYENKDDIESPVAEGFYVEERKGSYRRCAEYCEVAAFCQQYQANRTPDDDALWSQADSD
jgi:hypothetical protein